MSTVDIVRAWKDAEYRQSLSVEEQALLPKHPAGSVELSDDDLPQVAGGAGTLTNSTDVQVCATLVTCSCSILDDCTLTTITITQA